MSKTILYFADPMCSWCWGFAPVMEKVRAQIGDQADIQVFVGGLRPFTEHAMTDQDKSYVRNHWNHVAEASGQDFDFTFFDREDFTYDTEPACRAIVAVRKIDPKLAIDMLNRLHKAFYSEGKDTTDPDVLADLANEVGVPRGDFEIVFADEQTKQETLGEFQYAQRSGIQGFPTVVGIEGDTQPVALTMGFRPWDAMEPAVEDWLSGKVG